MSGSLISRNVVINGRRTSFRLEPEMWSAIEDICEREKLDIHTLCTWIIDFKPRSNRTSAIRAFIVAYLQAIIHEKTLKAIHDNTCLCGQNDMSQRLCYVFKAA